MICVEWQWEVDNPSKINVTDIVSKMNNNKNYNSNNNIKCRNSTNM